MLTKKQYDISMRIDEKRFSLTLAQAAERFFGHNKCPCCGCHMVTPRKKSQQELNRRDRRTIAHVSRNFDNGVYRPWVYACRGCNNDQGPATFKTWAYRLEKEGDPRAERVAALALFIDNWPKLSPDEKRRLHHGR